MAVCKKCGDCCRLFEVAIPLGNMLITSVEDFLGVKFGEIKETSIRVKADCSFFNKQTKLCSRYKKRPAACKSFYCGRYEDGEK